MAVVHQRISQLSSSGLMNIESSHKFDRSGDTASGCIEGVNLTDYQVGVIGGRMISGSTDIQQNVTVPGIPKHNVMQFISDPYSLCLQLIIIPVK